MCLQIKMISGTNEKGFVCLTNEDSVMYVRDYEKGRIYDLVKPPFTSIEGITGNNSHGPIIYSGKKIAYLRKYGDQEWVTLDDAPFDIKGISGDNETGPVIYNGKKIAFLSKYSDQKWVVIPKDAPFEIKGISGDNENGVTVYNGSQIAYITNYKKPNWRTVESHCPFLIEGISGDNRKGVLVFNNINFAYITNYKNPTWYDKLDAPKKIVDIAGDNAFGAIALLEDKNVYIMHDYKINKWTKLDLFLPYNKCKNK